jgi:glycogen debranching enzyme
VTAWADDPAQPPPATSQIIAAAQARARMAAGRCRPGDDTGRHLAVAADQLLIDGREGPAVVAGYPWFGEWSRDTMTSYEGLVLETGRAGEGRLLLQRAAPATGCSGWYSARRQAASHRRQRRHGAAVEPGHRPARRRS